MPRVRTDHLYMLNWVASCRPTSSAVPLGCRSSAAPSSCTPLCAWKLKAWAAGGASSGTSGGLLLPCCSSGGHASPSPPFGASVGETGASALRQTRLTHAFFLMPGPPNLRREGRGRVRRTRRRHPWRAGHPPAARPPEPERAARLGWLTWACRDSSCSVRSPWPGRPRMCHSARS